MEEYDPIGQIQKEAALKLLWDLIVNHQEIEEDIWILALEETRSCLLLGAGE